MNETKVNVFELLRTYTEQGPLRERVDFLAALSAIRELVEADREYDEANNDWEQVTSRDPDETDDETWRRVSDRFEAAIMRRIDALNSVGRLS